MPDHPLFMSLRHVDILNRRLVESQALVKLCSELERDLSLLYELHDGPGGSEVFWRTDFTRSDGIFFSLERGAGAIDVVISCGYWDAIDAVQGKAAIPTPRGDVDAIEKIMALLTSQEIQGCAVQVVFPVRPVG